MTPDPADVPAETPAALNGHPTPARQTAEGVAEIAAMMSQFPQQMMQALAAVLQQVPVQTRQHLCAHCLTNRMGWQAAHEREIKAALAAAAKAHGIEADDPRAAQLDPAPFLPERLQLGGPDGMPPLTVAVTTVGGTDVCSEHIPGRPGGKQLLIATGALSSSMLAGLG